MTAVVRANDQLVEVSTEFGPAIAYPALVGEIVVGSHVLLNRTATVLGLGTGGFDFVIAVLDSVESTDTLDEGHIVKLRYTPGQIAVKTLEEEPRLSEVWEKDLDGLPVVVCQLHSQIAHVCAAATLAGKKIVYVMTDAAALVGSFSRLATELKSAHLLNAVITVGQAFGGDYETVTVHSALLASKYYLGADVVVLGQGPGNVGTGTKYGFGGIEQASLLDTVASLGGLPIGVLRASSSDQRPRHLGISHHSRTTLKLVRSACVIPIPAGMITPDIDQRHRIEEVSDLSGTFDLLDQQNVRVTTMGRDQECDRLFFEMAAAAGKFASEVGGK